MSGSRTAARPPTETARRAAAAHQAAVRALARVDPSWLEDPAASDRRAGQDRRRLERAVAEAARRLVEVSEVLEHVQRRAALRQTVAQAADRLEALRRSATEPPKSVRRRSA